MGIGVSWRVGRAGSGPGEGVADPGREVAFLAVLTSCHFSTCPTSSGMPQRLRRAVLSGSASGEAGSHARGRNSRQSTAADA
ncbi:hypothetical protein BGM09_28865 [Streptomyces sp. CBMA29]|nr:hypothetical protein [Streptomyces sp. CBMA29]